MRYTLSHDFKESVLPIVPRCVYLTGNQRLPVSFLKHAGYWPFVSQQVCISRLSFWDDSEVDLCVSTEIIRAAAS